MQTKRFKIVSLILVALIALALVVTLAACDRSLEDRIKELEAQVNGYEASYEEKAVTIYVGEENKFTLVTRSAFLHDALKELKQKGLISEYAYQGEGISAYVTKIGGLDQDAASGKYYSVWHSVDEFSLKSVYSGYMPTRGEQRAEGKEPYQTVFVATHHDGKLLYYSNVGVGLLPLVDGATYAIFVD